MVAVMPLFRLSRRRAVSVAAATVLAPYTAPKITVLGAATALALSGPPPGTATATIIVPTATPVPPTATPIPYTVDIIVIDMSRDQSLHRENPEEPWLQVPNFFLTVISIINNVGGDILCDYGGSEGFGYYIRVDGDPNAEIPSYRDALNAYFNSDPVNGRARIHSIQRVQRNSYVCGEIV